MRAFIQQAIAFLKKNAAAVLAVSGLANLLVYYYFVVFPVNIWKLVDRPLLDFLNLVSEGVYGKAELLAVFALLAGLYFLGWWAASQPAGRDGWWAVLGFGAAVALLLVFMFPYGAADIFDYIIHARISTEYGANPYFTVFKNFPQDPFFSYAYWKNSPAPYGPLWEIFSALAARLAGDGFFANIIAFKSLNGIFYLASLGLIAAILRRQAPERALAGTLLFAWNPMLLYETFGNGHNDILMVFFLLLAAWAISRGWFALGIVAITAGALSKYVPVLLYPAAGLIALRDLPDLRARLRFILAAAAGSLLLAAVSFAPYWQGLETLTVIQRAAMYTSSLPSVIYFAVTGGAANQPLSALLTRVFASLTALFALAMGWRAWKDRAWTSFAASGTLVLLFYNLVANSWSHVWYALWPLSLAVLLPVGAIWGTALLYSFSVLLKPFFIRPLVLAHQPKLARFWRELYLWLGMQSLPWLYALGAMLRCRIRRRKSIPSR